MGTILETSQKTAPPSESDAPAMEHTLASLQIALKDMQAVKIEFTHNFRRLEELCSKRVEDAYASMRKLQMEQPCKGNTDCELEHIRKKNSDLIAVIKEKTLNEQYLLFVYGTQIKQSFKQIDNLLREANYGESAITTEARNTLYGAQQNQVMVVTDILERLKLERIIISNCARMAQEGRKK
jgi:xanthine/CO dehydrogenase XdhC/CoxF family maturation factor